MVRRTTRRRGLRLAAMLLFSPALVALADASEPGAESRTPPLQAVMLDDLRFGKLIAGGAATVMIDPVTGARRVSGAFGDGAVMFGPARFRISGAPNKDIVIYLPNEIRLAPGAIIASLTHDGGARPRLGPDGLLVLNVGGVLTLDLAHPVGPLSTSLTIDVAYDEFTNEPGGGLQ